MKHVFTIGATALISAGLGLVAGYKLAVHRLNDVYNEQMEEELSKTRAYYERNTPKFPDPVQAVKALRPEEVVEVKEQARQAAVEMSDEEVSEETLEKVIEGLKYHKITPAIPKRESVVEVKEQVITEHNVFAGDTLSPEDDENYEEAMADRENQDIYLVTQEEHMENPHEFREVTLTYYEGDSILVDEEERPIQKYEKLIGEKENLQFGRWSGDPNVVYIRNETLGVEVEILRSTGKYSVEVAGLGAD